MRIVYISHLSKSASTGPTYSVPARIAAQKKVDEVCWINLTGVVRDGWKETGYFHDVSEIGELDLKNINECFYSPDLFVFEGFYNLKEVKLAKELAKNLIPYIIVPRSSLTKQAYNNHSWLKKRIAHVMYFNSFCKNALAIQYLTNQEYRDSGDRWNKQHIIIPNGIAVPQITKELFLTDGIKAAYIGRMDIHQKGIDLLLKACKRAETVLRDQHFELTLYGPHSEDYEKIDGLIHSLDLCDIAKLGGEVLGKDKEKAILSSDLFVLTSRFEGHPMGLIEALSYGLPALVTSGTNMGEEIQDSNSGWVCEPNIDSIYEQLMVIVRKQSFGEKSANARQLSMKYDWRVIANDFHQQVSALTE